MSNDELRDRIIRFTTGRATKKELVIDEEKQQCWNIRTERFFFTVETRHKYIFVQVVDQIASHDRPIAFLYDSTVRQWPYEIGNKIDDLQEFLDKELLLDDLAGV